jgi:hypothetical protein
MLDPTIPATLTSPDPTPQTQTAYILVPVRNVQIRRYEMLRDNKELLEQVPLLQPLP